MELLAFSADNDNIDLPIFSKIHGVYLTAGDAADAAVEIVEGPAVSGGTVRCTLKAVQKTSQQFDFGDCGALIKGLTSINITGAGAIVHLLVS